MNILHISRTMDIGGAERVVFQLSLGCKNFFDKTFVASTGGALEQQLHENGIYHKKIIDLENKNFKSIFFNLKELSKIIEENDITHIHSHHRMAAFYSRLLSYKYPNIRFIYTAHNIFSDKKHFYRFSVKKQSIVAVGESVKKSLIEDTGIVEQKINVIKNSISLDRTMDNEKFVYPTPYILFFGRLSEQKGLKYLLDAYKIASNEVDNFPPLVVVGTGEQEIFLKKYCEKLEIRKSVFFAGFKENIGPIIENSLFTVLPSLWEGFPLSPLEVFQSQKTIIATDIPGTNEIVNESNGILVPPKNSKLLGQAMVLLCSDNKYRKKLEIKAKLDFEENYSIENFLSKYIEIYK